jgi:hypothetical protein
MEKTNNFLKENRSLKFLGILFLVGAFGIGLMTMFESENTIFSTPEEEKTNSNYKDLQTKIKNFKTNNNWKLADYQTVEAGINTSAEATLISGATKGNLLTTLNNALQQKTFKRCEAYLSSQRNDNPSELKELLNTLFNVVASRTKINFYKTQIDKYNYYEKVLPSKVNKFVSNPINYEDEVYTNFSKAVNEMRGFDNKYKEHSKFINISEKLIKKLDNFNFNHYNSSPQIPIKKIKTK